MSTLSILVEYAHTAIQIVGLPALFVVFVLKGALVGKVFPTSVFLSGYVVLTVPTYPRAAAIVVLVTVAHVLGQLGVFWASRRYGEGIVSRLPGLECDPDAPRYRRIDDWFARYGGLAVFATNVIPWSRGLIAIPAGISAYPGERYLFHVGTSTLLYHGAYVAVPLLGLSMLG